MDNKTINETVSKVLFKDKPLNESFHMKDSVLDGFTFEDLITTIQTSEAKIDEKTVLRILEKVIKLDVAGARSVVKKEMKNILDALQ